MRRNTVIFWTRIVQATLLTGLFITFLGHSLAGQIRSGRDTDVFHLSNGLKVIFQNNDASEITVCQILIHGGKKAEPAGKAGLSYLMTRLNREFPDIQTFQKMMDQATELNISGRMDYSQINIACLSDNFEETIKLISQIMLDPLFSSIRIDSIKKMMVRTQEIQGEDPLAVAHQAVLDSFFFDTPYSLSLYGTEASLKAIKKKDIDTFYENFFRTPNMIIAASSDLSQTEVHEILEKYFQKIPSGPVEKHDLSFSARIPEERTITIAKDTKQTLVLAAFPMPLVSSRNYILSNFLYYLIGHGANSKLWPLRVEKKLAYNVNTRLDLFTRGGVLEAYLETDNEKTEVAKEAMGMILSELFEKGMTEEELKTTKSYYKGAFLRQIETKANRTQAQIEFEALGLGYEFLDRIFQEIDATTLEEINGFIKTNLDPEKRLDLVVGPLGAIKAFR